MSLGRNQSTTGGRGRQALLAGTSCTPLSHHQKGYTQKGCTQWEFPAAPRESHSLIPLGPVELHMKPTSSWPTSRFSPRSQPYGRAKTWKEPGKGGEDTAGGCCGLSGGSALAPCPPAARLAALRGLHGAAALLPRALKS